MAFTQQIEPFGRVSVPDLIAEAVPPEAPWQVLAATEKPTRIAGLLRNGTVVILTGPYRLVEAVWRYFQHHPQTLEQRPTGGQRLRSRRRRQRRRHLVQDVQSRLAVVVRGTEILGVEGAPELIPPADWVTDGTAEWRNLPILLPVTWLQRILRQIRRSREGIVVRALDATIVILPHVYTPTDQSVVELLAENLELPGGSPVVLDMGCGCGVLGLLAARRGARVVATDNNSWATKNTRLNADRLGLSDRVSVREPGDLFEPVSGETFDAILFNAPWIPGEPKTLYDLGLYDPGYRTIDGFLAGVRRCLNEDGSVWLFYSDLGEYSGYKPLDHLREQIVSNGLRTCSCWRRARSSRKSGQRETVHLFWLKEL